MMTNVEVKSNMNKQLKPCPFCGGKAHIRKVTENKGYVHYETVCVLCKDCGARAFEKLVMGIMVVIVQMRKLRSCGIVEFKKRRNIL